MPWVAKYAQCGLQLHWKVSAQVSVQAAHQLQRAPVRGGRGGGGGGCEVGQRLLNCPLRLRPRQVLGPREDHKRAIVALQLASDGRLAGVYEGVDIVKAATANARCALLHHHQPPIAMLELRVNRRPRRI